jgi:hypothetical protein
MDTTSTTSTTQAMDAAPLPRWQGTLPGDGARRRRNRLRRNQQWSPAGSGDRAPSGAASPGVPVSSEDMSWPSQCERLAHFNQ